MQVRSDSTSSTYFPEEASNTPAHPCFMGITQHTTISWNETCIGIRDVGCAMRTKDDGAHGAPYKT